MRERSGAAGANFLTSRLERSIEQRERRGWARSSRAAGGVFGNWTGLDARAQAPTLPGMSDRDNCLCLLTEFVHTGDIANAGSAAAMIVAHLTTLADRQAQLAALEDLRAALESGLGEAGASGSAEESHVAVEDTLDKARHALARQPA